MMDVGIDVSQWNGVIDWSQLKGQINFAILRSGIGREHPNQIDKQFENNYRGCRENDIPCGVYHYCYATTPAEAAAEADFCLKLLKGKKFAYPIYYDIEEKKHTVMTPEAITAIIDAFCKKLEAAGYWAGVYSFDDMFRANIVEAVQKRYATWVASVSREPKYATHWGIHQYTWKGHFAGISGDVDGDRCSKAYPDMIERNGLNGFSLKKVFEVQAKKVGLNEADADELVKAFQEDGWTVIKREVV